MSKIAFGLLSLVALLGLGACSRSTPVSSLENETPETLEAVRPQESFATTEPQSYEASADDLLAARLPAGEASQGWVRLFDGHTLLGWEIAGAANWRIEDNSIVVDNGKPSLLCTAMPWTDFELKLEFRADPETNSGVFLRTPLDPRDVAVECYEVNIAPADNPFPTASVVKRQKTEGVATTGQWQSMEMRLEGKELTITVDGKVVTELADELLLPTGRIGLQHNSGRVAFRNVLARPLGLNELIDESLSQWKTYPKMAGKFSVNDDGDLRVEGGKGQLETKESFGDFVLLAEYQLPADDINTGIFFRCIPGDEMMGYECQVNDGAKDSNPLQPIDCGTGGIFRRQDARVIVGETGKWNSVLLKADGPVIAAWVNGVQVSGWFDDREPNENPRRGLRLEPGTIIIQAHDPGTDATYRQLKIR